MQPSELNRRIVEIDQEPESVRSFLKGLGGAPVLLKYRGQAIGVVYPAVDPGYVPSTSGSAAVITGAWDQLPDEVDQIGR